MATISSLNVKLTATTGAFSRGMKRAQGTVKAFARVVTNVTKRIFSLGGAIVGVAGIGGFAFLIKRTFDAGDALGKTADKLGLTTKELGGLQLGAKLAGIRVETMAMAVQRMARRISEAGVGTGEAKAAIKELGLEAKALAKLGTFEQFQAVADAMNRVQTSTTRLRLAFKIFDSEGVALVNLLRVGSKGLIKTQKDAERFGIALSRIDVAKFEMANDSLTLFNALIQGSRNFIALSLAPVVDSIIKDMIEWGEEVGTVGKAFDKWIDSAVRGIGLTIDTSRNLRAALKEVQAAVVLLMNEMDRRIKATTRLADVMLRGVLKAFFKVPLTEKESLLDRLTRGVLKTFFKVPLTTPGNLPLREIIEQREASIQGLLEEAAILRTMPSQADAYLEKLNEIRKANQEAAEELARQRKTQQAFIGETATAAKVKQAMRFGFKTMRELGFDPSKSRAILATNNIPQQQLDELRKLNKRWGQFFAGSGLAA